MTPVEHEVVVLGSGPAGCAAATLLARRSHKVALVRPSSPPAPALAESIPPSAEKLLSELGVLDAMRKAGFYPNRGNTVWWAGSDVRREPFLDDESGFHVDRMGLEGVLLGQAEEVGVQVYDGATARSADEVNGGWVIRCDTTRGSVELNTPWVLDATGRHGLLARKEGRKVDRSTTTLAIVRRWKRDAGWPGPDAFHTLVESYADGWAWSVPLDEHVRCFTAMIDQRHATLEGIDIGAMLDAELTKTEHLGPMRDGAKPLGDAWACPASLHTAEKFGRPGLLLVGDAGSSIDPLSSFGVKKALSSGWLAGVVAHTALIDPVAADMAVDFFDAREREVYRSYRRASVDFFQGAADAHGTSYWLERAKAARRAGGAANAEGTSDPDRLGPPEVPEAHVRAAFDEIRSRERLAAVAGATLRSFERPGIDGHRIVLRDHLASHLCPEGMRYVRNVDLRQLVDVAVRHGEVPDGWSAYNAVASPVTLPDYLAALATAFAVGFLEHDDA